MALKKAAKVGGSYLDLVELAEDGPVVVIFRIVEFSEPEPPKDPNYGPLVPVVADVLICDGERAGEMHMNERIIGAPTGVLRGVKNPKKGDKIRAIPDPENSVGDELVTRVEVKTNSGRDYAALQEPSKSDEKTAEAAWTKAGGEGWAPDGETAGSAAAPADDDEPPF